MLKKLKNKLKLILKTMTISILILMTLVNSFSLAADYIDKGSNGEFTSKEEGIVLKRVKTGEDLYYYFSPTQTGLYEVTAMGVSNSVNIANCLYRLDRVVKSQLSTSNYSYTNVSLASEKKGNEVNFATVNNDAYKLS